MENKRGTGFWILICIGILLNVWYLLGQTMAIISYDFTVSMGLQESQEKITAVGVALNKGFGFGDTFSYIPLFILGIIGLLKRKSLGIITMSAALGITIYWPMVAMSTLFFARGTEGWGFTDYTSYTVVLSLIAIYGIWGLLYLHRNRSVLLAQQ